MTAAKASAVVLAAEIDGVPCQIVTLNEADKYSSYWSAIAGIPQMLVLAGHTLAAVSPPAGAKEGGGEWTITVDVVCNAPCMDSVDDPLPIGQELWGPILDYAQHLAVFKEGPIQLQQVVPLLDRFMATCGVTLDIAQAEQPNRAGMNRQTNRDESTVPRKLPAENTGP